VKRKAISMRASKTKGKNQKPAEMQKRPLETSGGLWYNKVVSKDSFSYSTKEDADGGDRQLPRFDFES